MKRVLAFILILVLLFSFTAFAEQHKRKRCSKVATVNTDKVIVRDSNGLSTHHHLYRGYTFRATVKCQFENGGWFYGVKGHDGNEYFVYGGYLDFE